MIRTTLTLLGMLAVLVFAPTTTKAADYVWHLNMSTAAADPHNIAARIMSDLVKYRSKGKMELVIHDNLELASIEDGLEMTRKGTIGGQMCHNSSAAYLVRWLSALDLPFIVTSYENAASLMNGWLGTEMNTALEKHNLKVLMSATLGFRHFGSNGKPILTPDDIKGMKVRAMPSAIVPRMYEAWGAKPVTLPWSELYSAMQSGVVSAYDCPTTSMISTKIDEVTTYISIAGLLYSSSSVLINKQKFDALPKNLQDILTFAGRVAGDYVWHETMVKESINASLLKERGKKVYYLTEEQKQMFKEKLTPVYEWAAKEYGKELVERLVGKRLD